VVTLTATGNKDVFTALSLLREHGIRHLPVVDDCHSLLGLITAKTLRQNLKPINLMKWREASEVMNSKVVYAAPHDSARSVAMLMANHNVSCVAICQAIEKSESNQDSAADSSVMQPIGIITERDIVQFQNLGLDLQQPARNLMSTPLFLVSPQDSLWNIYQQMQQRRVRRLLVSGERGELLGIITQNSLLQVFEPTEMYGVIEGLRQQICQLETEREVLLQQRNRELEQEVQSNAVAIKTQNRLLQYSQAELRNVHQELFFHVNNSPLALVEWDRNFKVKRWSKRAEQMFGWQESEVLGKHWTEWRFVFDRDINTVVEKTNFLDNGDQNRNICHNRNYTKEGSVIDCEWYNSVLRDESGNLVSILSLVLDDTERQNALSERSKTENELQIRLRQQKAVAELGQFALAAKDLNKILERVVNLVATTLEVEYCKVLKLLPDNTLLLKAGVGWEDKLIGRAKLHVETDSQAGYTLRQSQPVIVDDLRTETRFSGPSLLIEHQVVSGVSMIITDGGKPYGVIGVHTTQHRVFGQNDLNFIQAIANIIAQANERQQAEISLKESQERYILAVNGSSSGIYDWDIVNNKVFYAAKWKEILGWTDVDLPNTVEAWSDRLHPEDRERVFAALQDHLIYRIPYNIEYRLRKQNGDYCWVQGLGQAIWHEFGQPVRMAGSITDITERKRQEKELRISEISHRTLAENLPAIVYRVFPQENSRMIFFNNMMQSMIGCSKEELTTGRVCSIDPFILPEDRPRVIKTVKEAVTKKQSFEVEYKIEDKLGNIRHFWEKGKVTQAERKAPQIDGVIFDISDRKRREKILKDIASGVSVKVGENFFYSLVEFLSKTLEVNLAFISKLIGSEKEKVETLAVYGNGEKLDNFEYLLANAPCGNVINRGLCIYTESVRQLFPSISLLEVMEAESYAGMPVLDAAGNVLGLVAVVGSEAFVDTALIEEVLRIFATRASTELERQQAELDLKQSEQKFRAIFDQSFQFIGLLEPNGKIIEANQTALEFVGLTSEDVRGKPFWQTPWWSMSVEIQESIERGIKRAAKGEFVRFEVEHPGTENRVVTVDFSLTPVRDETGKVILLIPEGRNISDRKQAEQKISEQAALLDIATDAIMVRRLDNKLMFWNHGAERLYGWTKAEALRENAESLLYRQSLDKLTEIQRVTIERGEWQGELNHVTKAGKKILVKSRWTLVTDNLGNPQSYLIVNTDITEQKQLEAQFLRTQRLESLGTLAGGIAHDLNNILAPILGFSKLLPLKLPDVDEQTKSFFTIIENNANRGTALVKQILTFSRGLEGDKGIVQIRHLIAEIGQIIQETFPRSIELQTNVPKNLWTVNADVNQLHQVLMNLSVNARDAMPEGGKLTINAENTMVDAEYARLHLDAAEGPYVSITVSDSGVGIDPVIIDRIFEPFFTTKEVGRGTGLGLSTVIGIIKSHDGFVEVTSDRSPDTKGTQFKVFLPASDLAENNEREAEVILQGNGELVLVVDDESAILEVTKVTLETYNYQVLTASNGIEAIATYVQNQRDIAVVIMDIMMPSMDGKTAIRTLKQINPDLKIIAVSGLIERQEVVAQLNANVTAYFAKPYSNDDLLKSIHEIISNTKS
jgi:PAS domain S-box-containing protein